MTRFFRFITAAAVATTLILPVVAFAEEQENYEADARMVGTVPTPVPHKISDAAASKDCLACHEKGLKGAPQTSHPERMGCTQCHVQGEIKAKKATSKAKGKK